MKFPDLIFETTDRVLAGKDINYRQALELMQAPQDLLFVLLASAGRICRHYKGKKLDLCSIVNAKCGCCTEDCVFCSQSVHHKTGIETYPLLSSKEIIKAADKACKSGAHRFGIVTSGRGIEKEQRKTEETDVKKIADALRQISSSNDISCCASLGVLNEHQAKILKEAGLQRYHHNLETSEDFFPSICTTHTWKERVKTVETAKKAGFEVCSGGIFGLGEKPEERLKLAFTLRDLDVDSVPLNFLYPVPGTPAADLPPLKPLEILKIIALVRFILPRKDIKICGGREKNLRSLQPMIFTSGANGMLIGGYLTTSGNPVEEDLQMLRDLELLE